MEGRELELKNHRIPLDGDRANAAGAGSRFRPTRTRPTTSSTSSSTSRRRGGRSSSRKIDDEVAAAGTGGRHFARSGGEVRGRSRRPRTNWPACDGKMSRCCSGKRRCRRATRPTLIRQFVDRGGQVVFFPPQRAERRRDLRRPLDEVGRAAGADARRNLARRCRICWPARKAARRCRSAS